MACLNRFAKSLVNMHESHSARMIPTHRYRRDVDGLRAIAVLSVIFYHFSAEGGGFIGVDIFFVISGYLITSLIVQSLHRNTFSFLDFYQRRIRRIFPALILVLLCTYAGALWSLNGNSA